MKKQGSKLITSGLTRRKFVESTAIAGAATAVVPFLGGKAPAIAQERTVHYLQWTSFIPSADVLVDQQAEEFTKATGIKATVEKINQNDMAARITAAVESGSGADVIQLNANQPHLFAGGLANHDQLIDDVVGDQAYEWAVGACVVDGVARAVPGFNIGNAVVYRKDIFDELGLTVPNTWEEYLEVGKTLK
ncbi:MAG: ABC transporter substrate-binding protein, partial [Pseudomonadota bacterium]